MFCLVPAAAAEAHSSQSFLLFDPPSLKIFTFEIYIWDSPLEVGLRLPENVYSYCRSLLPRFGIHIVTMQSDNQSTSVAIRCSIDNWVATWLDVALIVFKEASCSREKLSLSKKEQSNLILQLVGCSIWFPWHIVVTTWRSSYIYGIHFWRVIFQVCCIDV